MYATDGYTLIKWGYRSLWLMLFLSLIVCMGQWEKPTTLPFVASVICALVPLIANNETLLDTFDDDEFEYLDNPT